MAKNKLYSVRSREVVVEPTYALIFGLHGDHWILKKSATAWGAADAAGEVVIPARLPWLNAICEDRGATRDKSKKLGFVDGKGSSVIEPRFESRGGQDDMCRFTDGRCGVQLEGKIGFIDRDGEVVVPPGFVNGFFFGEGRGTVVDDGGWTYIDEAGEPITSERFDRAETFADGVLIVPVACSQIYAAEGVLTVLSEAHHTAYYRPDGSCIWKHAQFDLELSPILS